MRGRHVKKKSDSDKGSGKTKNKIKLKEMEMKSNNIRSEKDSNKEVAKKGVCDSKQYHKIVAEKLTVRKNSGLSKEKINEKEDIKKEVKIDKNDLERSIIKGEEITRGYNRKFKIIGVSSKSTAELKEEIKHHFHDEIQILEIYEVKGNHDSYNNAIINISNDAVEKLNIYPYLVEYGKKRKVFEYITIKQPSRCWITSYYRNQCMNSLKCRNCGERERGVKYEWMALCLPCHKEGNERDTSMME